MNASDSPRSPAIACAGALASTTRSMSSSRACAGCSSLAFTTSTSMRSARSARAIAPPSASSPATTRTFGGSPTTSDVAPRLLPGSTSPACSSSSVASTGWVPAVAFGSSACENGTSIAAPAGISTTCVSATLSPTVTVTVPRCGTSPPTSSTLPLAVAPGRTWGSASATESTAGSLRAGSITTVSTGTPRASAIARASRLASNALLRPSDKSTISPPSPSGTSESAIAIAASMSLPSTGVPRSGDGTSHAPPGSTASSGAASKSTRPVRTPEGRPPRRRSTSSIACWSAPSGTLAERSTTNTTCATSSWRCQRGSAKATTTASMPVVRTTAASTRRTGRSPQRRSRSKTVRPMTGSASHKRAGCAKCCSSPLMPPPCDGLAARVASPRPRTSAGATRARARRRPRSPATSTAARRSAHPR